MSPVNKISDLRSRISDEDKKQHDPGVWPGVWMTLRIELPKLIRSSSARYLSTGGSFGENNPEKCLAER